MNMRKIVKKYKLHEQPTEYSFWKTKSPAERLGALEQIRTEFNSWRYDAEQGLQRVYSIVKRT